MDPQNAAHPLLLQPFKAAPFNAEHFEAAFRDQLEDCLSEIPMRACGVAEGPEIRNRELTDLEATTIEEDEVTGYFLVRFTEFDPNRPNGRDRTALFDFVYDCCTGLVVVRLGGSRG